MSDPLRAADLRFINRVAARRFGGGQQGEVEAAAIDAALAESADGTAFARAATLAASLLRRRIFVVAPTQTALLAMHCTLAREGLSLLAPQGVVAGMVRELATSGDATTVAVWLEDRAVPATAG